MKTTNNVQKTETQKLDKPVSKIFALVISLVLISFTVSANAFWKQLLVNNSYGKMGIMMVNQQKADLQVHATTASFSHSADAINISNALINQISGEKNKQNVNSYLFWPTELNSSQATREFNAWKIDE